jgi:hypothetical protein
MIRFFGKQNKDQQDSAESRLSIIEWKVNLILVIVGVQLILTVLMFAKDLLMPSKTSIVICLVLLAAVGWFFRKQIPGLIRRMIAKQIVGQDSPSRDSSRDLEESIK